jgi:GxxExxY protein
LAADNPQITQIYANSEVNKDPQTYALIGAAMEVHKHLGHGFLEAVYQEALTFELAARGIPYNREVTLPVKYKNHFLQCSYRADFVCFETIILELKAISQLTGADEAQTINALKATGLERALLINFGAPSLDYERLVFNLRESAQFADKIKDLNLTGVQLG